MSAYACRLLTFSRNLGSAHDVHMTCMCCTYNVECGSSKRVVECTCTSNLLSVLEVKLRKIVADAKVAKEVAVRRIL